VSLVSDALKKAEREAAAREAREKGLPIPLEAPTQPYRARRGQRRGRSLLIPLAFAGGAAAVVLAVVLARSSSPREAAHKGKTGAASAPQTPAPGPAASAPEHAPGAPSTIPPAAAVPAPGTTPPLPKTTSKETRQQPSAREPAAPSAVPATAAVRPAAEAPRQTEYVRRVDFPGGGKLELGGIAYSEAAPFAYLNGKLLKVGEGTAGYTLVRIERDRVVVRGAEGNLTIRLRP
jgi:hypothetical protein